VPKEQEKGSSAILEPFCLFFSYYILKPVSRTLIPDDIFWHFCPENSPVLLD